jgi:hypothetical protein
MDPVTYALRLDILRTARDRYQMETTAPSANSACNTLATLKMLACEVMLTELTDETVDSRRRAP